GCNRANLMAGTYTVTVTDANSCNGTSSFAITQPFAALSATATRVNVTCNGLSNGSVILSVSGGTSSYFYLWSDGSTTQNLINIPAGTYTVTITDNYSCTRILSRTITQPSQINITGTVLNVSCYGESTGAINLFVTGGTAPYSYNWSDEVTSKNRADMVAGLYSVIVTDANNCIKTSDFTVTQPVEELSATPEGNDATGNGLDGSINLEVSGGTSPFNFFWSNGSTSQNLENISAGVYTVIIIDNNSCIVSVSDTISQSSQFSITGTVTNVNCYGESTGGINLIISGGLSPYSFNWGGGVTAQNRSGLSAGLYAVTVTDTNSNSGTANFTVNQPLAALSATASVIDATCFGLSDGSVILAVSGGKMPYSYFWSNGLTTHNLNNISAGTYTVTITDDHSCTTIASGTINQPSQINISGIVTNANCYGESTGEIDLIVSGSTTPYSFVWDEGTDNQTQPNLAAGTYTVSVFDENFCSNTASFTINQPSEPITATITGSTISCYGFSNGNATLLASGGTYPYTYLWSNGSTTQGLSDEPAGFYSVTITDNKSCIKTATWNITQPNNISINATMINVKCHGDSTGIINAITSGGTAPYTYNWGNGILTQNRTGLFAGTYLLTVTDANNCNGTMSFALTQPSMAISATATVSNVTCNGLSNGSIGLTVLGGTTPYTYLWSNGSTTQNLNNAVTGTYTVTLIDNNFCSTTISQVILQPAILSVTTNIGNIPVCGLNNGSLNASVSGGISPYTFNWSDGATSGNIENVAGGNYFITVTDYNNCKSNKFIYLPCNAPDWQYINTGVNHTILVTSNTSITINGAPISVGDYLGVFYESGDSLSCGGYMIWRGLNNTVTAWGDDPQTPSKEGFSAGESFKWKIWEASSGLYYNAYASYIQPPVMPDTGYYQSNGVSLTQ
ncbi:MAG: SprB repeat-containing protein, partial [Bacteroidia bacterium]|nr:SprB repeat-containing protein [Bacteroidia bacterium]